MDGDLYDLLRRTRSEDLQSGIRGYKGQENLPFTHISFYGPHARWQIKTSKLTEFWSGYCDIVYEGIGNYSLAERALDHMPIIAECTFRFLPRGDLNLYQDDFILSMVYCYQEAILELLNISDSRIELICVVLEAEKNWMQDNHVFTSLRLQFPYCRTETHFQIRQLRSRVIELLRTNNVVKLLQGQPVNDWEAIIDPIAPQEPILMYKSTPTIDRPKMILNHMFGPVTKEHIEEKTGEMIELGQVFTPSNHTHVQQGAVSATIFSGDFDIEYWIPMFLSIHYWNGITSPKQSIDAGITKIMSPKLPTPITTAIESDSDIEIAEQLLPMLNRDRVEEDSYWMDIGRALFNSDIGGEKGLNKWISFTECSDNHSEEECRELYPGFYDNRLTVKTIAWYAQEDSPKAYKEWHKDWCIPSMIKAASCLHSDVAQALYRVYWLDYKCSSMNNHQFWLFKNHRWIRVDHGIDLRKNISSDFLNRFETLRTDFSQQIQESTDEGFKNSAEITMKKLMTLISKLKTVTFKTNLMKEVAELFYDGQFEKIIDTNPDILGMLNGVIETVEDQAIFRPGKPEDFVSMCTGLPYIEEMTWKHSLVERLLKWINQVFPDDELREYFLKIAASCLRGRNSDKIFPIWTGEGDNSKSMVVKLFESTFGSYCAPFPTSLFTQKRGQSSGPTPEIAQAKGARVAIAKEPDDEETLKGGIVKEFTGGDTMPWRDMYQKTERGVIMFKLFFMCNKIPVIPNNGKAMKNRTLIVPFLSTWVSDPPESEEEQYKLRLFKKDPFFERKIPELAKAFIWVLVQYYPRYKRESLGAPKIIEETTQEYWRENDIYENFIHECVTRATNDEGNVDVNASLLHADLYRQFKSWFKETYPGAKIPESPSVRHEFVRILGKQHKHRWHGIRLVMPNNANNLFPF